MQQLQAGLGAVFEDDGRCKFRVWAPFAKQVELHLYGQNDRFVPLERDERGYHQVVVDAVSPGQLYRYRLDAANEFADPASRYQPEGVLGPSQVTDSHFSWSDQEWHGVPLQAHIIYELHIGTFSPEGTFGGALPYLDELTDLGITAVEVMPVNQFSGVRGWGYDGVFPFAVQNSYGTPQEFKAFVNACHERGLAVILDVVYNHFGPEGNYVWCYGPYTTDRYKTPWGEAMNFDGAYSDEVRAYFLENALYWIHDFHIDSLRLDAIHTMIDTTAKPFIEELVQTIHKHAEWLGRPVYLFAESDNNKPELVRSEAVGGIGMDAQWLDDFHHALHALLTYECSAYYEDYGQFQQLVKSLREGFVYDGQYSPSRKRRHGAPSRDVPVESFVVFVQNHDQIGNRMPNERAVDVYPYEALKLALGWVLFAPYLPMLFMGDEYGETAGFEYFIDYHSHDLVETVRQGRRESFGMRLKDGEIPPDPQAEETFTRSRLNRQLRDQPRGKVLLDFHKHVIRLRKTIPALRALARDQMDVFDDEERRIVGLCRWSEGTCIYAVFNFSESKSEVMLPVPQGTWHVRMDSSAPRWQVSSGDQADHSDQPPQTSDGRLLLTLPPLSFLLLERVTSKETI
jgi:maltooligosyltrehalose trehalohydrolase